MTKYSDNRYKIRSVNGNCELGITPGLTIRKIDRQRKLANSAVFAGFIGVACETQDLPLESGLLLAGLATFIDQGQKTIAAKKEDFQKQAEGSLWQKLKRMKGAKAGERYIPSIEISIDESFNKENIALIGALAVLQSGDSGIITDQSESQFINPATIVAKALKHIDDDKAKGNFVEYVYKHPHPPIDIVDSLQAIDNMSSVDGLASVDGLDVDAAKKERQGELLLWSGEILNEFLKLQNESQITKVQSRLAHCAIGGAEWKLRDRQLGILVGTEGTIQERTQLAIDNA